MFNLNDFRFAKPYYRQGEFLELFSISLSTLMRFMEEWLDNGRNLEEMGHLNIKGFKETCWEPKAFLNWLVENKIEVPARFDYEVSEQNKLQNISLNIPNKLNQLKGARQ